MRFAVTMVMCVLFGLMAEGHPSSAKIEGDTLVWWPRDFKGVAVVPSSVRHIGNGAFSVCKSLTGIVFSQSVETIGAVAFMGCENLRDVQIPLSVTNIGCSAFGHCLSLTSLVVRARIGKIPAKLCVGCYALRCVELPDGVTEVDGMAFCGCRSIRSISLPESVRRIGPYAFAGCCRMSYMSLPKRLQCIDDFAFSRCYDMNHLIAHSELKRVGAKAFENCFNLRGVVFVGRPPDLDEESLLGENKERIVFAISSGHEPLAENYREEWMRGCKVELSGSVEEAVAVCNSLKRKDADDGMFSGLERALRLAAEGLVAGLPENNAEVGNLDAFAAELHKLKRTATKDDIRNFIIDHSRSWVDVGTKISANFDVPIIDVCVTAEFENDRLTKLVLSEGLKNAIREGLRIEGNVQDESVLRWLK